MWFETGLGPGVRQLQVTVPQGSAVLAKSLDFGEDLVPGEDSSNEVCEALQLRGVSAGQMVQVQTPDARLQSSGSCCAESKVSSFVISLVSQGKVRDCDLLTAPGPAEEGQMLQAGPGVGVCSPGILCTE